MSSSQNEISILILEGESNFFQSVVNCLSQIKRVSIYLLLNKKHSEIRYSRKLLNVSYYPKAESEKEWIATINGEIKKYKIDIIMPTDEFGIETIIKNKLHITDYSKLPILSSLKSFNIANNKGLLAKHLLKHAIPCPKTFFYSKNELLENIIPNYPILIKPTKDSGGGKGIFKFKNFAELKNHLLSNKFSCDFIIQEFIKGYDCGCNILAKEGEIKAFTIQKGRLWDDSPFSYQIGLVFLYEQQVYNIVEKLIKSLNWSGVANIDLRFDERDRSFKVLEINPRFWGTTEASEIAGVNFPYLYALLSLNEEFKIPKYKHVKFLSLLGLKKTVKMNRFFIFNWSFIFSKTPIKYYMNDPLPFLFIIFNKIKTLIIL